MSTEGNAIRETEAQPEQSRSKTIVRTSIIGILANVFLAAFKAVIGRLTNSIASILDAVNNISDAASSIITIIGTKLAGKEPDKKHPFGHGRIEYLSAMIISVIILYAGITSLIESVKKIIHPATPDYTVVSLVIVAVAVLVKIFLGRYVKGVGEKVNSDSLVNSGKDAMLDSIISAATLVAAIIFMATHLSLEAWLGAVISLIIIKSGIEMLRETISHLLGEQGDIQLAKDIKKTVAEFPNVQGAYDLILHNYGPDAYNGSVHIEVPDTLSADEIDRLTRQITAKIYDKFNVILSGIGVYAYNTKDPEAISIRDKVEELAFLHKNVLQMHGFYLDKEAKTMRFDLVISFNEKDRVALYEHIVNDIKEAYPEYKVDIQMDMDFNEE